MEQPNCTYKYRQTEVMKKQFVCSFIFDWNTFHVLINWNSGVHAQQCDILWFRVASSDAFILAIDKKIAMCLWVCFIANISICRVMVFEEESAKILQYYFVSYFPPEVVMDIYPCRSRTPAAHLLTFVLCAQLEGDWKTCLFFRKK